jgi:hypothetical protein
LLAVRRPLHATTLRLPSRAGDPYPSASAAEWAIAEQQIHGALLLTGLRPLMFVASGEALSAATSAGRLD